MHIDQAILTRISRKVLATEGDALAIHTNDHFDDVLARVMQSVEVAGMAPFHYPAHGTLGGDAREPWRCTVLHRKACVDLKSHVESIAADGKGPADGPKAGKVFSLLDAAEALVLVYVAVEASQPGSDDEKRDVRNMEHMLATGAFVQNVLLGLTSRNLHNYWSSGGILKSPQLSEHVFRPNNSALAAAVFVNSPLDHDGITTKPGRWRTERCKADAWTKILRTLQG